MEGVIAYGHAAEILCSIRDGMGILFKSFPYRASKIEKVPRDIFLGDDLKLFLREKGSDLTQSYYNSPYAERNF